ncbi:hypothetical protein Tco_0766523 [Tanacetum coccineum]
MAAISNVPQLVDKKEGNYYVVAPRLEPGKINKWKKRMLCYLKEMETYYIQRKQDHGSENLSIKLAELNPLRVSHKPTPDTRPRSMSLPMMGLRNANHTQNLDLADIYGRISKKIRMRNLVLMALADDELSVRKNHARNGKWIDITMKKCKDYLLALKQAKLEAVTFQIQNTELTNEQIPNQKKKILGIEQLTESSSKSDVNENPFIPASLDYDHEMVPKSKDWVEGHNPDIKLPNFNTGSILVLESQAVNECLQLTEAPTDLESSKESGSEPQTPLPPMKNL